MAIGANSFRFAAGKTEKSSSIIAPPFVNYAASAVLAETVKTSPGSLGYEIDEDFPRANNCREQMQIAVPV